MDRKVSSNGSKTMIICLLIIICSGIVYFSYLNRPDNFTRRQVRTVICAREMNRSGNYTIPTMSGVTRFRKPPLPYWLICLSGKLNNNQITTVSSRVYSVIAGMLILLMTWWWAFQIKKDSNHEKALLAPLILIIIPLFYLDVRSSEAEIILCFFILAASYFFWKASLEDKRSGKNLLISYIFISGGFLTKGPLALIMPLLPYILIRKKRFLKEWPWHLIGLAITIIPVGLWVLAVYIQYPEAIHTFIKEIFTKRFGGEAKHAEPFYYYILLLIGQLAIFLPILVQAFKRALGNEKKIKFNVYFIIINLIWLSLMSSKQQHYIIPLFPHLSIILGVWLGERADTKWVIRYFKAVSYILGLGVIIFGIVLLPQSILTLVAAFIGVVGILVFSRRFLVFDLWKSAIFFLVLLHLGDLFVTDTGNRLQYEKLMAKWIRNNPINNSKIVFVEKPEPLMAYYFDYLNEYVSENEENLLNRSDYFIVEGSQIKRFINDRRFYMVKRIDEIKKGKKEHEIALFGKTGDAANRFLAYRLLFLSGNNQPGAQFKDLKRYNAIVPEINPLESLGLFTFHDRIKWEKNYMPILNNGVELICKFDPDSSLYRKAWFNDASYWGVTPDAVQRRSFFNGRYFLWTVDAADLEKAIGQLENELKNSSSRIKLVFFQSSTETTVNDISKDHIKQLKKYGATIVNERMKEDSNGMTATIGFDDIMFQQMNEIKREKTLP